MAEIPFSRLGLGSLLTEEEKKQKSDKFASEIIELVRIQEIIEQYHEVMIDKILQIEHNFNEGCKRLYHCRNDMIENIPHFWGIVFSKHPVIRSFLQSEDHDILDHLTSLEVEEFKDEKSGYSITLNFKPNRYFEDKVLTKTFTFLDKRTTEITATSIKWKEEKVGYIAKVKKKQKIRPTSNQSFFTWFSLVEEKEIFEDFKDEIADSIKQDLWPNPLSYFESLPLPAYNPDAYKLDGDIADDNLNGDIADDRGTEKGEVQNNQIDEPCDFSVAILKLVNFQHNIHKINQVVKDKVLEVEQWHNEMCKPAYSKRNEIINAIPNFWAMAFLRHPVLTTFIREEDEKIFKHLKSLEVEGIVDDVKLGYTISFNFETNEYFKNTSLTKTYTFIGKETKISATPVEWEKKVVHDATYGKLSPGSDASFFSWFNVLEEGYLREMEIFQDLDDMIALSIKDDLWPNPLKYFCR